MTKDHFDVAIIGGGVVALTSAIECAQRGISVAVIHGDQPGIASTAAAGMLAPSIEPAEGSAGAFAFVARDMYPEFITDLEDQTGSTIPFDRSGILELVAAEDLVRLTGHRGAQLLSPRDLQSVEPGLRFAAETWALMYPNDGWVDNVRMMGALWTRVRQSSKILEVAANAQRLTFESAGAQVLLANGTRIGAAKVVLAAGAWVNRIEGLPRVIPVEPWRGQMLSVEGVAVLHVIIGATGYTVPRLEGVALLGSTMEQAGFDNSTTDSGVELIRRSAAEISVTLGAAREAGRWAGLRPVTPDLLPIIGADPEQPAVIYACGHSRNGILLGPLTGRCVGALVSGEDPSVDLGAFGVGRFTRY